MISKETHETIEKNSRQNAENNSYIPEYNDYVRTPNDGNTEFISNFTPGNIVTPFANVYVRRNRKVRSGTGKACGQGVREGLCN